MANRNFACANILKLKKNLHKIILLCNIVTCQRRSGTMLQSGLALLGLVFLFVCWDWASLIFLWLSVWIHILAFGLAIWIYLLYLEPLMALGLCFVSTLLTLGMIICVSVFMLNMVPPRCNVILSIKKILTAWWNDKARQSGWKWFPSPHKLKSIII